MTSACTTTSSAFSSAPTFTMPPSNPWLKMVQDESTKRDKALAAQRDQLVAGWRQGGPWAWMTAVDPTTETGEGLGPGFESLRFPHGRPLIWTTDERDNEAP